ncbi:MAG TPA: FAD-dependent monooxygenase [Chitinophaga sp.]|uniref:FAD-dependent oxidoreductase n=1 Tax=Chitinophaga sp. TaxID=1869181 RepID=UPI002B7B58E8|nr:FAD-dependent monooxygenase [Chitinophaga sp.]HVI46869.1 FAD-dependent monooxygenase [Chitinophaga sp.]
MTSNSNSFHVLIAGGGIGGLALALFLKKAGISCCIYEAFPYKEGAGGGFNIAPNGMNVLAALGLAERVKEKGTITRDHVLRNGNGKILARMSNGNSKYGEPGVTLSRAALYDVMTAEIFSQDIPIFYEKRLQDIYQDDRQVTIYFSDGSNATGDILVGADGVHSRTRGILFPQGPAPAYIGIVNVGGFTPLSAIEGFPEHDVNSLNYTFGPNGFFGYSVADKDTVMWWSNLPQIKEMTREELQQFSLESIKAEMLNTYRGYHDPVERLILNTEKVLRLNMVDIQSLPVWHRQRVMLIGDAAHAVSPNAGQGAAMALEDAMYLAMLLRVTRGAYGSAFAKFEADRKPRVEKIVAEGRRRGTDKKILTPFQAKIRDMMIRIFVPLFGEKGLHWLYRYKLDWEQPPLPENGI